MPGNGPKRKRRGGRACLLGQAPPGQKPGIGGAGTVVGAAGQAKPGADALGRRDFWGRCPRPSDSPAVFLTTKKQGRAPGFFVVKNTAGSGAAPRSVGRHCLIVLSKKRAFQRRIGASPAGTGDGWQTHVVAGVGSLGDVGIGNAGRFRVALQACQYRKACDAATRGGCTSNRSARVCATGIVAHRIEHGLLGEAPKDSRRSLCSVPPPPFAMRLYEAGPVRRPAGSGCEASLAGARFWLL